jgi:hypothetical protein
MTYQDALTVIKARYAAGERSITVSPEVWAGYLSGLVVLEREVPEGWVKPEKEWLAFKDARLHKAEGDLS